MAARENQGLQIALIIFVMLTIVLIVTTFLFFQKSQEGLEKINALTKDNASKEQAARKALDEYGQMKTLLDPQLDAIEGVKEAAAKDLEAHGKGLAEKDQHYRGLVSAMAKQLVDANTRITEITAHEKELADKLAAEEAATKQAITQYTETIAKVTKDLDDRRKEFDAFQKQMDQDKGDLSAKFEETRKRFDELTTTSGEQITALTTDLTDLKKLLDAKNAQGEADIKANEVSDGKIDWVNQRSRTVWINVGSEDGLRLQTAFSVFPNFAANPVEAKGKGKIEVTRLMGPHMAEARILSDDLSTPLMPGDLIFSPTWAPGRPEHFALVGMMDIDDDGVSDRQRVRDLITMNGGVIDAEVADDGQRTGKMSINTKYLVRGSEPPAVEGSNAIAGWSEINAEAQQMGTRMMNVHEFLDYMGYEPTERSVALGAKAKPEEFRPRLPDGIQRVLPGSERLRDIRKLSPTRDMIK
ncbi:MAG: hypothetical protein AB7O59_05405 [Pirellulales bacterium]